MSKARKILGTEDAWENGELGEDLRHAKLADPAVQKEVQEALAMQMISIRLPRSVIEVFKAIASIEGVGYQPLMREALCRFAECEAKRLVVEIAAQKEREAAEQEQAEQAEGPDPEPETRKAA